MSVYIITNENGWICGIWESNKLNELRKYLEFIGMIFEDDNSNISNIRFQDKRGEIYEISSYSVNTTIWDV